jgi:hypothetical protein
MRSWRRCICPSITPASHGPPASTDDFHRRTPSRTTLDRVFQLEETRVLSNDWVIRYETRCFQVARQSHQAPARSTVLVRENASGAIEIRYRERLMQWTEIAAPVKPTPAGGRTPLSTAPHRPARPRADHPWRRDTRVIDRERMLTGPPSREASVEAAAAVDAKNAPTAAWKPTERFPRAPTSRIARSEGDISISLRMGTFLFRVDNPQVN